MDRQISRAPFCQAIELSELQGPGGAGGHAGRKLVLLDLFPAEITLAHPAQMFIKLGGRIGADPCAVFAPNAFFRIDGNDAMLILVHGFTGT